MSADKKAVRYFAIFFITKALRFRFLILYRKEKIV